MLGVGQAGPGVLTIVEWKSGFVAIGKLHQRTGAHVNARARRLVRAQPRPVSPIIPVNSVTHQPGCSARQRRTVTAPAPAPVHSLLRRITQFAVPQSDQSCSPDGPESTQQPKQQRAPQH